MLNGMVTVTTQNALVLRIFVLVCLRVTELDNSFKDDPGKLKDLPTEKERDYVTYR